MQLGHSVQTAFVAVVGLVVFGAIGQGLNQNVATKSRAGGDSANAAGAASPMISSRHAAAGKFGDVDVAQGIFDAAYEVAIRTGPAATSVSSWLGWLSDALGALSNKSEEKTSLERSTFASRAQNETASRGAQRQSPSSQAGPFGPICAPVGAATSAVSGTGAGWLLGAASAWISGHITSVLQGAADSLRGAQQALARWGSNPEKLAVRINGSARVDPFFFTKEGKEGSLLSGQDLPKPEGVRFVTLNQANGSPDARYRSEETRASAADMLGNGGANVIALQEVDDFNSRSGNVNTALDMVQRMNPAFAVFSIEGDARFETAASGASCTKLPCKQTLEDGTVLYRTRSGTLSFHPADLELQFADGPGALKALLRERGKAFKRRPWGNAIYMDGNVEFESAATIKLPEPNPNTQKRSAGVMRGSIEVDGKTVQRTVINTQLKLGDRKSQYERLAEMIRQEHDAGREVVLMGDFNAKANDPDLQAAMKSAGMSLAGSQGIDLTWVSATTTTGQANAFNNGGVSDHGESAFVDIP